MSDYVDQEYPKWKYHTKQARKVVQNAEDEKVLGDGWYDHPGDFAETSQFLAFIETRVKPHWNRWAWMAALLSALLAVVGGIIKLSR